MIQYDPHRWLDHFFDIRGALVREISLRVAVCVAWAAAVVIFHNYAYPVAVPGFLHSLVGVPLGLLLVFRTNASYDRFWEGRRLWGGIVNETRNLIRGASLYFRDHPLLLRRLTFWTAVFPWSAISTLRGDSNFGPLLAFVPPEKLRELQESQHPALYVAKKMTEVLVEARQDGVTSDFLHTALDQNIQLLVDYVGGCERIRKTPLPFAYVIHLRRVLVLYCFTLPFAMVETFGWATILDVLMIAYTFFGIEEIGVEIEGPFGYDANDLPMEDICITIQNNVFALAGIGSPQREILPDGL